MGSWAWGLLGLRYVKMVNVKDGGRNLVSAIEQQNFADEGMNLYTEFLAAHIFFVGNVVSWFAGE